MNHRLAQWVRAGLALLVLGAGSAWAQMAPWEKELYEAAKKEKPVTVYTAHYNTETAQNLCNAFEKKYPGLKCNFVRTTAQVAYQRFQQDLQANAPVASVFSSTDVSHYPDLKKRGLLMQYKPHNLANMVDSLKQYNDKDDYYHVTAAALMADLLQHQPGVREGRAEELDRPARSEVEGQGVDRPPRLQRLRRHLGGVDAEALRLGLLRPSWRRTSRRSAARSTTR